MFWMIVTRFFCETETLLDFPCTLKAGRLTPTSNIFGPSRLVQSTSKSQSLLITYPDIWRGMLATFTEAFQMPIGLNTTFLSD